MNTRSIHAVVPSLRISPQGNLGNHKRTIELLSLSALGLRLANFGTVDRCRGIFNARPGLEVEPIKSVQIVVTSGEHETRSGGVAGRFTIETIRQAKEIVIAVSTFSWLAAWLSSAERIHMPASGLFNPRQRPDVELLPVDDNRYEFYECAVRQGDASTRSTEDSPRDFRQSILFLRA